MSEIFEDRIKESFEKKGIADRNLARVEVSFPAQFVPISEEEFKSLKDIYVSTPTRERSGRGGGAPRAQADASGTMTAAIFERLDKIEEKLDLLIIAAGMEAEKSRTPAMEIVKVNDLSGSGVRMSSQMAVSEGWYLKLTFNLPGAQPFYIETLARVIRSGSQNRFGYFESACQFEAICEEDQDRIIAYVFRRQRELAHNRGIED